MFVDPRFFGLLLAGLFALNALAQDPGAKSQTARPEIGKPIQAAIDLLKNKKSKEALAKVREAQALRDKTPYESYLVERVFGQAAAAAGEAAIAAQSLEIVAASAFASGEEKRQFLAAAAGQYYVAKSYAKAAELAARYFSEDGRDKAVHTIYVQALYLGNNFAAAAKVLTADIEAEEQAGKTPAEEPLQLLANACLQLRDTAGYARALEKLVAYHPKRDYWLSIIHSIATTPGFSQQLAVDVARLKIATGTMRAADEYVDAAQLSLQNGFPMEASRIIDQGYAAGLLGAGAEAERHKRLKAMAARSLAEDKKALAQDAAQTAAGKDAKALLNEGYNYVLHGRFATGLAMMEHGIRQAGKRSDHARLQLAYAYHLAGQKQKAIEEFKTVQGTDGAAALARLWVIRLSRAS